MTDQIQQAISKFLAMMAAGAIGAILSVMVSFGGINERVRALEDKTQSMPPIDYRALQDERIRRVEEKIERHERYQHKER